MISHAQHLRPQAEPQLGQQRQERSEKSGYGTCEAPGRCLQASKMRKIKDPPDKRAVRCLFLPAHVSGAAVALAARPDHADAPPAPPCAAPGDPCAQRGRPGPSASPNPPLLPAAPHAAPAPLARAAPAQGCLTLKPGLATAYTRHSGYETRKKSRPPKHLGSRSLPRFCSGVPGGSALPAERGRPQSPSRSPVTAPSAP